VESNFWEQNLRLVVADGRVDDDILAFIPVDGGSDLVLITELESYELCQLKKMIGASLFCLTIDDPASPSKSSVAYARDIDTYRMISSKFLPVEAG
jgi:hypothetical protein